MVDEHDEESSVIAWLARVGIEDVAVEHWYLGDYGPEAAGLRSTTTKTTWS